MGRRNNYKNLLLFSKFLLWCYSSSNYIVRLNNEKKNEIETYSEWLLDEERDPDFEPDLEPDRDLDFDRDLDLEPDLERDFERDLDLDLDFDRVPDFDLDGDRLLDREFERDLDLFDPEPDSLSETIRFGFDGPSSLSSSLAILSLSFSLSDSLVDIVAFEMIRLFCFCVSPLSFLGLGSFFLRPRFSRGASLSLSLACFSRRRRTDDFSFFCLFFLSNSSARVALPPLPPESDT